MHEQCGVETHHLGRLELLPLAALSLLLIRESFIDFIEYFNTTLKQSTTIDITSTIDDFDWHVELRELTLLTPLYSQTDK